MGSRGFVLLKFAPPNCHLFNSTRISSISSSSINYTLRNCSSNSATTISSLEPPDVSRLAETARISLTPEQVEEFAPKIRQVVDWFGQLQAVDLSSVDPSIRADNEPDNLREDSPETFGNREAIIAAIPSYEEPYIRVPKVLNKE